MITTIQGGYSSPTYNVTREGNQITIQEPPNGCRGGRGEYYNIDLGADVVTLRSYEKNYDITMHAPDEMWVQTPDNGMRCGGEGFSIKFDQPVADFHRTALTVASSLCGVPIVFAEAAK